MPIEGINYGSEINNETSSVKEQLNLLKNEIEKDDISNKTKPYSVVKNHNVNLGYERYKTFTSYEKNDNVNLDYERYKTFTSYLSAKLYVNLHEENSMTLKQKVNFGEDFDLIVDNLSKDISVMSLSKGLNTDKLDLVVDELVSILEKYNNNKGDNESLLSHFFGNITKEELDLALNDILLFINKLK